MHAKKSRVCLSVKLKRKSVEKWAKKTHICTDIDEKLYLPETMTSDCSATAFADPKTYKRKIVREAKTTFYVVLELAKKNSCLWTTDLYRGWVALA